MRRCAAARSADTPNKTRTQQCQQPCSPGHLAHLAEGARLGQEQIDQPVAQPQQQAAPGEQPALGGYMWVGCRRVDGWRVRKGTAARREGRGRAPQLLPCAWRPQARTRIGARGAGRSPPRLPRRAPGSCLALSGPCLLAGRGTGSGGSAKRGVNGAHLGGWCNRNPCSRRMQAANSASARGAGAGTKPAGRRPLPGSQFWTARCAAVSGRCRLRGWRRGRGRRRNQQPNRKSAAQGHRGTALVPLVHPAGSPVQL